MLAQTLKNIPRRVVRALGYSWDGLKSAFVKEEAFRLESMGLMILILTIALVPWPGWKKAVLLAVYFFIPLTELMNSAVEDLCDLASTERHPLIKAAKDKASAAVLLAIILNVLALAALIMI